MLHIKVMERLLRELLAVAWRHPKMSGKFWSGVLPSLSKVTQLLHRMKLRITSQLEVSMFLLLRQSPSKPIMKCKYQSY